MDAVFNQGVVYSVCDGSYAYSITGFWAFVFCMSKLPELIDTVFIVLRKQVLDSSGDREVFLIFSSFLFCFLFSVESYLDIEEFLL